MKVFREPLLEFGIIKRRGKFDGSKAQKLLDFPDKTKSYLNVGIISDHLVGNIKTALTTRN